MNSASSSSSTQRLVDLADDETTFDPLSFSPSTRTLGDSAETSKLDVLRSNQINVLTRIAMIASVISIIWVISHIVLYRTVLAKPMHFDGKDGKTITVDGSKESSPLSSLQTICFASTFVGSAVLTLVFLLRVFRNNTYHPTQNQIMVSIQIILHMVSQLILPFLVAVR